MSRILFCWELGRGAGHLTLLRALGRAVREADHTPLFAVRHPGTADAWLTPEGFTFWQAPVALNWPPVKQSAANHAEILLNTGFDDSAALLGRARAWRSLFDAARPDMLVCEHAPTALLASHGLDLPCIAIGTGFTLPPADAPWPSLQPWVTLPAERLTNADATLLTHCNAVLAALNAPLLPAAHALYATRAQGLFTLPELDHYPTRPTGTYWGPLSGASGGGAPDWPAVSGPKIFAYLRPFATLAVLLETLRQTPAASLVYLPEQTADYARFAAPNLRIVAQPLDMARITAECDMGICHGSHSTTAELLLAGKPLLFVPLHLEMQLTGYHVQQLGAGLSAPQRKPAGMAAKLTRLLNEPGFATQAKDFADRYAGTDPAAPVQRFVALVDGL